VSKGGEFLYQNISSKFWLFSLEKKGKYKNNNILGQNFAKK
jgi:hypothetical protein